MPANQNEYAQMVNNLRSIGHVLERTPGNLGSVFAQNSSGRSQRSYLTDVSTDLLMTEGYYDQHGNVLEAPWPRSRSSRIRSNHTSVQARQLGETFPPKSSN